MGKLIDLSDFKTRKERHDNAFKSIANNFKKQREQIKTLVRKDEFLDKFKRNSQTGSLSPTGSRGNLDAVWKSPLSTDEPLCISGLNNSRVRHGAASAKVKNRTTNIQLGFIGLKDPDAYQTMSVRSSKSRDSDILHVPTRRESFNSHSSVVLGTD